MRKDKLTNSYVNGLEEKTGRKLPWLKGSLGFLWTIFWIFISFLVQIIFIWIPILLILIGLGLLLSTILGNEGAELVVQAIAELGFDEPSKKDK